MSFKYLLPLLVAVLVPPFETQGALIPLEKAKAGDHGLIFIGSLRHLNPVTGTYYASVYYASPNDASWEDAREDCKTFLGGNGHLFELDTAAELAEIEGWFATHPGTGTNYWTGGRYNVATGAFDWDFAGTPVGSFIPWDTGYPIRVPISRIEFRKVNSKFATDFDSTSSRYLCEVHV